MTPSLQPETELGLSVRCVQIYHTRPLFPLIQSCPRAGARLSRRLRTLLLRFAHFSPPPASLNSTSTPTVTRVPPDVLSDAFIDSLKTRCCFVGEPLTAAEELEVQAGEREVVGKAMKVDEGAQYDEDEDVELLLRMERRWSGRATATTIGVRVPGEAGAVPGQGVGKGWIQVPGWVRERAAEVLFEDGGKDEPSVQEIVLECLLKVSLLAGGDARVQTRGH